MGASFLSMDFALSISFILAAAAIGVVLYEVLFRILKRMVAKTATIIDDAFFQRLSGPSRLLLPLMMVLLVLPSVRFSDNVQSVLKHLLSICLIPVVAWALAGVVFAFRDAIVVRFPVDVEDNLKARAIHTQINVLTKIVLVIIIVITAGSLLMTFEKIRQIGVSILASAGIAGIIIGFAAQRSLSTIFAGFQIALTRPIRLDDVVIVENEWGWIEEITLTYVVVRIWDLRRLVLPITYFLERPFQNWTRSTANLLGTVFIYADYTVPVKEVREELHRVLQGSELWDGKVWGLQVTNATEHTMEMRALMSTANSSIGWDLRCHVREQLLEWLQKNYPESLPRARAELSLSEDSSPTQASR